MRKTLLSSCGYLGLMLVASNLSAVTARAADVEALGSLGPTTYLSFEGGYLFNSSPSNIHFDPDDDKLGNLDSLKPGDDGAQFRFELGQVFDSGWDYKVALGAIMLSDDKTSADYDIDLPFPLPDLEGTSTGKQDLSLGIADFEMGFRPDVSADGLDVRLFGGVRVIHASNEGQWQTSDEVDKLGAYDDSTWAVGPRLGLDATMPIDDQHQLSLVGSLSGSVLFGKRSTDERLETFIGFPLTADSSESVTIWNVDAMAGLQMPVGERASLTFGYKAQQYWNLVAGRTDAQSFFGDYESDGEKDVLVHGPFLNLTVAIPGGQ